MKRFGAFLAVLAVFLLLASLSAPSVMAERKAVDQTAAQEGYRGTCPANRVSQWVVTCGENSGPGCLIVSETEICVLPDEMGFQLHDPESLRQHEAAKMVQNQVRENLVRMGKLAPERRPLENVPDRKTKALAKKAAHDFLASQIKKARDAREEGTARQIEAMKVKLDSPVVRIGDSTPTPQVSSRKIVGGCEWGQPCDDGSCLTRIYNSGKVSFCMAACMDCKP